VAVIAAEPETSDADAADTAIPATTEARDAAAPVADDASDATPFPPVPAVKADSLIKLVAAQDVDLALDAEQRCLASAIYYEAKGESLEGQLAVARVVMARRDSPRFPSTICGVVTQPHQFSFVRGGQIPTIAGQGRAWRNAVAISRIALADSWDSPVEGALFFHARHVAPSWRKQRMAVIDNHVFYR